MDPAWLGLRSPHFSRIRYDASKALLDVEYADGKVFRYSNIGIFQTAEFLKKCAVGEADIAYFKKSIEASSKDTKRIR